MSFFIIEGLNKSALDNRQSQIIHVKCKKSQLFRHFDFFQAIIELIWELLISNMHNKFEEDTWKLFKISRPQGQIINVKWEKSQYMGHFELVFSHYWTCPRTGHT